MLRAHCGSDRRLSHQNTVRGVDMVGHHGTRAQPVWLRSKRFHAAGNLMDRQGSRRHAHEPWTDEYNIELIESLRAGRRLGEIAEATDRSEGAARTQCRNLLPRIYRHPQRRPPPTCRIHHRVRCFEVEIARHLMRMGLTENTGLSGHHEKISRSPTAKVMRTGGRSPSRRPRGRSDDADSVEPDGDGPRQTAGRYGGARTSPSVERVEDWRFPSCRRKIRRQCSQTPLSER